MAISNLKRHWHDINVSQKCKNFQGSKKVNYKTRNPFLSYIWYYKFLSQLIRFSITKTQLLAKHLCSNFNLSMLRVYQRFSQINLPTSQFYHSWNLSCTLNLYCSIQNNWNLLQDLRGLENSSSRAHLLGYYSRSSL